ncbi:hypothetical protein EVAR_10067_1 [Eumeta japonica]|uniref:Uncharacterized protein n=1 Tax=Eumeta variegata TaxID=151549 RepID=A0A4C1TRH7_EUMVA|nr:hypothetical protein EVAR_10067_1 [Eumeta japonica]
MITTTTLLHSPDEPSQASPRARCAGARGAAAQSGHQFKTDSCIDDGECIQSRSDAMDSSRLSTGPFRTVIGCRFPSTCYNIAPAPIGRHPRPRPAAPPTAVTRSGQRPS